jgi:membrane protein DedA with SNARE-associated domain
MLDSILQYLQQISLAMPLPLFVVAGSLLEEAIAIIPSPFVTTLAGSIAAQQNSNYFYLALLAILAGAAKTLGSWVYYVVADKAEDILASKYGKYLGVSHKSIESIGKKFEQGKRDDIVLFLLRATPLMPTAPISLAAGIIKVNMRHYLWATFAGLTVRSFFFIYLGYTTTGTLTSLQETIGSYEVYGKIALLVLFALALAWFWKQRRQHHK